MAIVAAKAKILHGHYVLDLSSKTVSGQLLSGGINTELFMAVRSVYAFFRPWLG